MFISILGRNSTNMINVVQIYHAMVVYIDVSVSPLGRHLTNVIPVVYNSKLAADVTGGDCLCWDVHLCVFYVDTSRKCSELPVV